MSKNTSGFSFSDVCSWNTASFSVLPMKDGGKSNAGFVTLWKIYEYITLRDYQAISWYHVNCKFALFWLVKVNLIWEAKSWDFIKIFFDIQEKKFFTIEVKKYFLLYFRCYRDPFIKKLLLSDTCPTESWRLRWYCGVLSSFHKPRTHYMYILYTNVI